MKVRYKVYAEVHWCCWLGDVNNVSQIVLQQLPIVPFVFLAYLTKLLRNRLGDNQKPTEYLTSL